jgi:hypothetical protein
LLNADFRQKLTVPSSLRVLDEKALDIGDIAPMRDLSLANSNSTDSGGSSAGLRTLG